MQLVFNTGKGPEIWVSRVKLTALRLRSVCTDLDRIPTALLYLEVYGP